jgi:hypothetical protein
MHQQHHWQKYFRGFLCGTTSQPWPINTKT